MNEMIYALSWKQPYGTLMLHDKIETRSWHTNIRGKILICLSKLPYKFEQVKNISGEEDAFEIFTQFKSDPTWNLHGHAIAIGTLVDCRRLLPSDKKTFVEFYPDLFAWIFKDVHRIQPFPWKGSMGFKALKPEEKKLIKLI